MRKQIYNTVIVINLTLNLNLFKIGQCNASFKINCKNLDIFKMLNTDFFQTKSENWKNDEHTQTKM